MKTYKPFTPSRRYMTGYDFSGLTKKRPEKSLTVFIGSTAGRNNKGRITTRHRGGGHKRLYRIVDFRGWDKINVPAKVASIEYDPYRTCRIALVHFVDGEKRYVLAWKNASVGDMIMCGDKAKLSVGNRKQLKDIPDGFTVYNLEVTPMTIGKLVRSAGAYATITGRDEENNLVYIKLQSGEIRKFNEKCRATIGLVGNEEHKNIVIGKAGRARWMGKRPEVKGKAMNPVDHAHGGGEGRTDLAMNPKSFRGKDVSPGKKTRNKKKWSDKFIVKRRKTRFK